MVALRKCLLHTPECKLVLQSLYFLHKLVNVVLGIMAKVLAELSCKIPGLLFPDDFLSQLLQLLIETANVLFPLKAELGFVPIPVHPFNGIIKIAENGKEHFPCLIVKFHVNGFDIPIH